MKIRKMTATFGCLDGAVLELSGGVNVMCLPNEGGKSTWAAFLLCMFYGLDPKRSVKGKLSDKERFAPWSGKAMEGTVELSVRGRELVLQRTSTAAKPFGVLKVWDKTTGLEVPSLTADNCGVTLFGASREVFRRTAFLNGEDLTVSQGQELSRRLNALAAAGRETDSFELADNRLKTWQHRLRYHNTGTIVKVRQELDAALQGAQAQKELPSEDVLLRLLGKLCLETSGENCPAALQNSDPDDMPEQARKDLSKRKTGIFLAAALTAVFLAAGLLHTPVWLLPCAVSAGGLVWMLLSKGLCKKYGVGKISEILPTAVWWRERKKEQLEQAMILQTVQEFAPWVETADDAKAALQQALRIEAPAEEKIASLHKTLEELEKKEKAIILARQALDTANKQLRRTYVPQLTKAAGEYLRQLTLGSYDGLVMNEEMELSVRQTDGLIRPLASLSTGTKDQTWLALRLAMTKLLLPPDAPVIMDDALLTFDKDRERAAMALLEKENRQIIVFTCR